MYKYACDQTTTHTVNDSILPNLHTILSTNVPLISELFVDTMCIHVYICTLICVCTYLCTCVWESTVYLLIPYTQYICSIL